MKHNLKSDNAVSPVIAVILMVAITVVLAAVVYVWVSQFGDQSHAPAGSLSLQGQSQGPNYDRNLTVTAASPGLVWGDLSLTLDGSAVTFVTSQPADGQWAAYGGSMAETAEELVNAGDRIWLNSASSTSGQTLRVAQASSNTLLLTMRLG